ncbi:MAG: AraC family transcriptional regulator [Bradyrhizobium sp.]|uniref:helix-turn-helix transcriptional regulator n=1 Tax=Bradyrhizobium sp. TaxID=376 RepID=UPI0025BBC094|nr:AraC family transcriptional regulator [Bradyrhizobium sp.]MBI5263122.1 AraC family transcriptional regulator [Bradyrhizobium sp.]
MKIEQGARFHFCTDDLPAKDRLAIWREVIGRRYMQLEIEPHEPNSMWARIDVQRLPSGEISSAHSNPARYRRTRKLANDGNGDFSFMWMKQAGYRLINDDSETTFAEGDGVLLFHGAPGTCELQSRVRWNTVRLDGALLRSRSRSIGERPFHRADSRSGALHLLTAYIAALVAGGVPSDPALAYRVNEHIADLIAAAVQPNDDNRERAAAGAVQVARFAAVTADILAHLSDPELSAKQVAQRVGLSERSVYLLFERNGVSFVAFVTEERLQRARAMLVDPACRMLRIGDIAFAAGFSDLTTFNRSFRRLFGRTPSDLRREIDP